MSVIGDAALSLFVELLGGKLVNSALNFVADHKQLRQQLKQWQSKLPDIQAVLDDAEEKQIKNEGVKKWLDDLQDLAYDVDDILDDNFSPTSFLFKNSMIPKEKEITDRLNNLTTRRNSLGLSKILSQAPTSKGKQPRLQPTSVVDGAVEYVGRHEEKTEMIELLKGDNSNRFSVLSIVGMGGMVNITRTILKPIGSNPGEENDLNLLQVKLKEKLSGKRFLLVLDDIWNENNSAWPILRSPFGAGTSIIVTTCLQIVSSIVDPLKAFYLDKLSNDDCLTIFTQHALKARNFDGHLQFKEIGEKIVRRCNGLPLATKAIGSLLRTVKDFARWERIYESEIWKSSEQCDIIPALRLSYYHLPSYLKQCFAYCSILPKDYEFEEEEIILLWRVEGLLQQKYLDIRGARSIERMPFGIDKLTNLEKLSDFIIGEGDGHHISELKYLSNLKGDFRLSGLENVNEDTRKKEDQEWVLDSLHPSKRLEQLVIENYGGAKFPTWIADSSFKNMLSLKLSDCKNCKSLPSIARLLLLKDLLIGGLDEVHKIGAELFGPNQSSAFTSLGTLCFESMPNWEVWDPCEGDEQASKFPSLRELSIRNCPQLLGRLPTLLRSLHKLEIIECTSSAEEVTSLKSVSLTNISNFESNFPPTLKELEIWSCENLQYLFDEKENNKSTSSSRCLLENLEIVDCPSLICLSSRADICNQFQHLKIHICSKLSSLFLNAKLPVLLKQLDIWGCPMLECIVQDFHETTDLESIRIGGDGNIKSLPRGLDKLSHLQEIRINGCPSFVSFEESGLPTTNLKVLSIQYCENFRALPKCINNFTSLGKLKVVYCSDDISFPEEGFPTNLTSLEISNAPQIYTSLVEWGFNRLSSLQQLNISGEGCSHVVSFPEEGIERMLPSSLTSISIRSFENLEYMCSKGFQHLTSLQQLSINNCPKLTSLPDKDMLLSLERLFISYCSSLEEGREWSKIAHIPKLDLNLVSTGNVLQQQIGAAS
ncbi:hypothetical protein GOBAR_AA24555 [Gossypium barbadense]|uniref:Rx N-terminal domain-containing protein n=1 Tax=Gossypium barbadense TaxID=3634 RepID=A0A2P5WYH3_GOSBA|nr:hypothetical protein GOBAR_AA24555 [Gossypium barbadense]